MCSRHKQYDRDLHIYMSDILEHFSNFNLSDILQYIEFLEPCDEMVMTKVIQHAVPKQDLLIFGLRVFGNRAKSMTSAALAEAIGNFYFKLHRASKYVYHIRKFQRRWREKIARRMDDPSPSTPPVNSEEPFTCEEIRTIPVSEIFRYRDSTGRVYAFRASHLFYSIKNVGHLNPFTREPIPEADIKRLQHMIKENNINTKILEDERWRTPEDAFTDVLYDYEVYGFYTSLEWFAELSVQQIYDIYSELSLDRNIPMSVFSLFKLGLSLSDEPNGVKFCFADDMKNLIKGDHPMKFYIICSLFVVLAIVNPNIRGALPNWVLTGAVLN